MHVNSSSLGRRILRHWQNHFPHMVTELQQKQQLDQALSAAQERTADLLYELVSVNKMQYHAAWEIAMQEWALPPTGDRPSSSPRD